MVKAMKHMVLGSLALVLCTANAPQDASPYLTPQQAVMGAAESGRGLPGQFVLTVRASGRDGALYLNSERDYRDPRNLSIVIGRDVEIGLQRRFGASVANALEGRAVVVRGTARKTRIDFLSHGRRTGKYYYQTHLRLTDPSNLTLLPG